jgi:hypothetical protein
MKCKSIKKKITKRKTIKRGGTVQARNNMEYFDFAQTILGLLEITVSSEQINNYASYLTEYMVVELRSLINNQTLIENKKMMIYALKTKLVELHLADINLDHYLNKFNGHTVMGSYELTYKTITNLKNNII